MNTAQATAEALALVIKDAMRENKITQRAASEATGIPLVTLNRKLRGTAPWFNTWELAALADLLSVSLVELALRAERRASDRVAVAA